jgi:Thaumatin family
MWVNHTGGRTPDKISSTGCVTAGCTRDATATCPRTLRIVDHGAVVACRSACVALGTDQTCCRGEWAPRSKCDPARWPIDSAAVFKRAEPFAYSYVNDDATSVFTCSGRCDYRITFGRSP